MRDGQLSIGFPEGQPRNALFYRDIGGWSPSFGGVIGFGGLTRSDKDILGVYLRFAHDDGERVTTIVPASQVVREVGICDRTVRRATKRLAAVGLIVDDGMTRHATSGWQYRVPHRRWVVDMAVLRLVAARTPDTKRRPRAERDAEVADILRRAHGLTPDTIASEPAPAKEAPPSPPRRKPAERPSVASCRATDMESAYPGQEVTHTPDTPSSSLVSTLCSETSLTRETEDMPNPAHPRALVIRNERRGAPPKASWGNEAPAAPAGPLAGVLGQYLVPPKPPRPAAPPPAASERGPIQPLTPEAIETRTKQLRRDLHGIYELKMGYTTGELSSPDVTDLACMLHHIASARRETFEVVRDRLFEGYFADKFWSVKRFPLWGMVKHAPRWADPATADQVRAAAPVDRRALETRESGLRGRLASVRSELALAKSFQDAAQITRLTAAEEKLMGELTEVTALLTRAA